jgi:hypothetical protein
MIQRLIVILFLFPALFVSAQDTISWSSSVILNTVWEKHDSTIPQFRFKATIRIANRREKLGKTQHHHLMAYPGWLKGESSLPDSLAERYKSLAQLYFDCYELEARILQELINLPNALVEDELSISLIRVRNQIAAIGKATNEGQDRKQMSFWKHRLDSCLTATPRMFPPDFRQGLLGMEIDAGPGTVSYNGELGSYFTTKIGWGWGLGTTIGNFTLGYRTLRSFTHAKQDFSVMDFAFSDTNRLQVNQSTWSLGYQVLNTYRWTITPYLGISTFRIINRDQPQGSLFEKSRVSYNAEGGIAGEWRFYHFYQNNGAQFFWKLLLKAGYAKVNYLDEIDGGAFKFQLGIGWTIRSVVNVRYEY